MSNEISFPSLTLKNEEGKKWNLNLNSFFFVSFFVFIWRHVLLLIDYATFHNFPFESRQYFWTFMKSTFIWVTFMNTPTWNDVNFEWGINKRYRWPLKNCPFFASSTLDEGFWHRKKNLGNYLQIQRKKKAKVVNKIWEA